jgi:hypothetical protein
MYQTWENLNYDTWNNRAEGKNQSSNRVIVIVTVRNFIDSIRCSFCLHFVNFGLDLYLLLSLFCFGVWFVLIFLTAGCVSNFNTPFPSVDRSFRQNFTKERTDLNKYYSPNRECSIQELHNIQFWGLGFFFF